MYSHTDYSKDPEKALQDTIEVLLKTIKDLAGDLYTIGLELEGLREERDTLADENKHFSDYLSRDWAYTQRQIEQVARTGRSPTPQEGLK
jgi:hypothetical protein